MEHNFKEIKKNFGFGCMRLPMKGEEVDYEEFSRMVDTFLENGFNYFDTAHMYVGGKSESAIRECLTRRYPREKYILTDKLSRGYFESEEDIRKILDIQLKECGVDYFDFYLMHAVTAETYPKYVRCNAFEVTQEFKREGKIRHVGLSFHDKADVLDRILTEHPELEVVQLQFNYRDYDDEVVQSYQCYQVCEKHKKPVIVMEPVKGGQLINLPNKAKQVLDELRGGSYASYAIRFCASFPQVFMVLSGMGNMEMMNDNVSYMKDFVPFSEEEHRAVAQVREILKYMDTIPCTACRYCTDVCPRHISIPDLFSCYNDRKQKDKDSVSRYSTFIADGGRASECIKCGKCESMCPQHLRIREYLEEIAEIFEAAE